MAGDTSTLITLKKFVTECNFNKRDQSIFIASVEENFTGGIILFSGGNGEGIRCCKPNIKSLEAELLFNSLVTHISNYLFLLATPQGFPLDPLPPVCMKQSHCQSRHHVPLLSTLEHKPCKIILES